MRIKTLIAIVSGLVILLIARCANPSSGTDTGNAKISGVLYNADGSRAAHAKVACIPRNHNPHDGPPAHADSTETDDTGGYRFKTMPADTYNILARGGDTAMAYIDPIVVTSGTQPTHVPPDTLKAAGSIQGRIELEPGDDARNVFIIFLGTYVFRMANDSVGNFAISNLAEGRYRVRILANLPNYRVMDTAFAITAGRDSVLPQPIRLEYTGIPIPKNLRIVYDTMKQIVTLIWDKPTTGRTVQGYNIYRKHQDSASFERIKSGVTDTTYNDSTGMQDQTYEYRVAVVDTQNTTGVMSTGVSITFVSSVILLDSVQILKPVDRFAIGSDSMFYSVYIGENFVRVFNKSGDSANIIGSGDLSYASDIAIDSRNRIYAVASNGIFKYSSNGIALSHWIITEPSRITIDENDFLYIIYNNRHSIAKLDTAGTILDSTTVQSGEEIVSVKGNGIFVGDGECLCVRIFDTNLVQRSTIELQLQVDGHSSYNIVAADAAGRLYVREIVSFVSQGIVEVHIFDLQGTHIGKFQPRGGNDLSVSGNTLYLVDREQGLSIYRLPF